MKNLPLLGFTGTYRDSIGAYYPLGHGYRWYLPNVMRFNAPDSFSPFDAGGINPYIYCDDDPVNRIDPSGHINWSIVGRVFRRFFDRTYGHAGGRAISATLASEAPESADTAGDKLALRAGVETRRASLPPHAVQHEQYPSFAGDLSAQSMGTIQEPPQHVYRVATLLEKIDLHGGGKEVLRPQVFVRSDKGRTYQLSMDDFLETFAVDTKSNARLCSPRAPMLPGTDDKTSAELDVRPRWTAASGGSDNAAKVAVTKPGNVLP